MPKSSGGSSRSKSDGAGYQGGVGGRKGDYSGSTSYDKEVGRNQRMNSISTNTTVVPKNNEGVYPPPVRRNPFDTMYTPVKKAVAPAVKKKAVAPVAPVPVKKATKKVTQITIPGKTRTGARRDGVMTSKDALGLSPGNYGDKSAKFSNGKTYTGITVTGGRGGSGGSVGNYSSTGDSGKSGTHTDKAPATRNK